MELEELAPALDVALFSNKVGGTSLAVRYLDEVGGVIPVLMQHYVMLRRNLLYTGIMRGRKLVVLVGQSRAIAMAVRGKAEGRR